LPATLVAHESAGEVVYAVDPGLDERRDTTPWVTGMIVRQDRRREGIGRVLMKHLERWAAEHGIAQAWVGTDLALTFYQRCGWVLLESFTTGAGEHMDVLHKRMA
jgi:GNAT superfamily N-acetyltransferase